MAQKRRHPLYCYALLALPLAWDSVQAGALDLFGVPNSLFCPDLFHSDAEIQTRLLEAYARVLESYRGTMPEVRFQDVVTNMLSSGSYYSLPKSELAAHAPSDLVAKIEIVVKKNGLQDSFDSDVKKYLKNLAEQARVAVRAVEKTTEETATARAAVHVMNGHQNNIWAFAVNKDFTLAFTTSSDQTAILWDLETTKAIRTFPCPVPVTGIDVNADFSQAIGLGYDGIVVLWDLRTGEIIRQFDVGSGGVIRANADFTRAVVTADITKKSVLLNLKTGRKILTVPKSPYLSGTRISPDLKTGFGFTHKSVVHWNIKTAEAVRLKIPSSKEVQSAMVSPDFKYAIASFEGGILGVWDLTQNKLLKTLKGHTDLVFGAKFSRDQKQVLTASRDGTLILWDLETGKAIHTLSGHKDMVYSVVTNEDFTRAISQGRDRVLIVWDLKNGSIIKTVQNVPEGMSAIPPMNGSTDLNHLVGVSYQNLLLWNLEMYLKEGF